MLTAEKYLNNDLILSFPKEAKDLISMCEEKNPNLGDPLDRGWVCVWEHLRPSDFFFFLGFSHVKHLSSYLELNSC